MTTYIESTKSYVKALIDSIDRSIPGAIRHPGLFAALALGVLGCNGLPSSKDTVTTSPAAAPQKYMASVVYGDAGSVTSVLQSFTFDDTAKTFQQSTYSVSQANGSEINNSGSTQPLARGLLALNTTYSYKYPSGPSGVTYSPAQNGSWAVELANQAGGLVQLLGQPVTPLVAATACPASKTAQTYQFVTTPDPLFLPATGPTTESQAWNPAVETAYGSVGITGSGSTVNLSGITQSTFPGVPGSTGTPATPSAATVTGVCSSTPYGETTSTPGQVIITDPGDGQTVAPTATFGVSPTGLLVESNGVTGGSTYQNSLGAGTGAIGLPKPASALDTGALVGAQYLGFFYGSGNAASLSQSGWSSAVASFGFSSVPSSCAAVTSPTATLIYGGDFTNNDPSAAAVQSGGGYGNCDYAIDLGQQDAANNGLYTAATVWVGASFSGNTTGKPYSFPAVAVAGQLGGKYAIFLLGVDTTGTPIQAEGIYLLQSN